MLKKYEMYLKLFHALYHDLHVQTDILLLADIFEKFRDKFIEINGPDPSHFLPAPGLVWQACLKRTSRIRVINRH